MVWCAVLLASAIALASGVPTNPVIRKLDETRYQYVRGPDGTPHLVDLWLKTSDLKEIARYEPDRQNIYHLFTRDNPTVSQPLLMGVEGLINLTNYDSQRRTILLIHGWLEDATANSNNVLIPAFLTAEDVNVIAVDWSIGAGTANYAAAVSNTITAGESIARFINWLNDVSGTNPSMYHILGHNLGGHMAGIVGRNLDSPAAYITALDAANVGWVTNDNRFSRTDGAYTEAIHTNAGVLGFLSDLGQVDFYPNGGVDMPGCFSSECDHARSYHYMAESITSGGFRGRRCASFVTAMLNQCQLPGTLNMGGLQPKPRSQGIYYLRTNIFPPFSRG